jgi:hypothetical protein
MNASGAAPQKTGLIGTPLEVRQSDNGFFFSLTFFQSLHTCMQAAQPEQQLPESPIERRRRKRRESTKVLSDKRKQLALLLPKPPPKPPKPLTEQQLARKRIQSTIRYRNKVRFENAAKKAQKEAEKAVQDLEALLPTMTLEEQETMAQLLQFEKESKVSRAAIADNAMASNTKIADKAAAIADKVAGIAQENKEIAVAGLVEDCKVSVAVFSFAKEMITKRHHAVSRTGADDTNCPTMTMPRLGDAPAHVVEEDERKPPAATVPPTRNTTSSTTTASAPTIAFDVAAAATASSVSSVAPVSSAVSTTVLFTNNHAAAFTTQPVSSTFFGADGEGATETGTTLAGLVSASNAPFGATLGQTGQGAPTFTFNSFASATMPIPVSATPVVAVAAKPTTARKRKHPAYASEPQSAKKKARLAVEFSFDATDMAPFAMGTTSPKRGGKRPRR